jgi:hypothetical protein
MRILALDLAGQTGFARWDTSMPQPSWGTLRLPTGTQGICYASFRDALLIKISADRIEHIVVESVFVSPEQMSAVERLYGLIAIVREVAYRKNIPVNSVTVTEWRAPFIGQARAPKHLSKPQRRSWLKNETRKECARRGWQVSTDDEADALGLLVYERARLFPEWGVEGSLFGYGLAGAA